MNKKISLTAATAALILSGCVSSNSSLTSSIGKLNQDVAQLKAQTAQLDQKIKALEQSRMPSGVLAVESERGSSGGYNPGGVVNTKEVSYANALSLLQAGDIDGSITIFEEFLSENPSAESAPMAKYWLGTAYYSKRDYQNAQRYLGRFLAQSPNTDKTNEALSKLIISLKAIGRDNEAALLQRQGVAAIATQ